MSQYTEIDAILTALGGSATVDEVEYALRDYGKREILAVLADRAAGGGGGGASFPDEWTVGEDGSLIIEDGDGNRYARFETTFASLGSTEFLAGSVEVLPNSVKLWGDGWNDSDEGIIVGAGPTIGFFGASPAAKPTGVAVTAEAIHAALVTLGLITGP